MTTSVYKQESTLNVFPTSNGRVITIVNVTQCVDAIRAGVIGIALSSDFTPKMSIMGGPFLPWQVVADNNEMEPVLGEDGNVIVYKKDCDGDKYMRYMYLLMDIYNKPVCSEAKYPVLSSMEFGDDVIVIKKLINSKKRIPSEGDVIKFESHPFALEELKEKQGKMLYRPNLMLKNDDCTQKSVISWVWELNRSQKHKSEEELKEHRKRKCLEAVVLEQSVACL